MRSPPCQLRQLKQTLAAPCPFDPENCHDATIIDATDRNTHASWEVKVDGTLLLQPVVDARGIRVWQTVLKHPEIHISVASAIARVGP